MNTKIMALSLVGCLGLATACSDNVQQKADQVRDQANQQAESLRDQAKGTVANLEDKTDSVKDNMEQKADAIEDQGEQTADRIEDRASNTTASNPMMDNSGSTDSSGVVDTTSATTDQSVAANTAAENTAATPEVDLKRSDIVEAQTNLASLGYLKGPADGVFGAQTRAALRAFQTQNSLTPSAVLDSTTRNHLKDMANQRAGQADN